VERSPEPEDAAIPERTAVKIESNSVKRERQEDHDTRIKQEPGQPRSKRTKKYKVTIDLTADSDSESAISLE
jgi:hypothetical protein